ncbi:hypothetical protein DRJ16_07120 [Candidatus Woesearchaeota archaeon]|nr:MAG: hypothetical protein DRJ16_07120 [Candidatus Woesearchaeota archaeon]
MKKWLLACLIVGTMIAGVYAGIVIFSGKMAEITMTVMPPSINHSTISIELGTLGSLQDFDSGIYDPDGIELSIEDVIIPVMVVYPANLSQAEAGALQSLFIDVVIYNTSGEVMNGTIDVLADEALSAENLTGDYDVRLRVYGKTGLASNVTPIAFDLMFDLDPEVIYAGQSSEYNITLYDAGSGVRHAIVRIDGRLIETDLIRISPEEWLLTWRADLNKGVHRLHIEALDNADNLMTYDAFIIVP